jgi:hypothetical protein
LKLSNLFDLNLRRNPLETKRLSSTRTENLLKSLKDRGIFVKT